jgi:hypothetical protein
MQLPNGNLCTGDSYGVTNVAEKAKSLGLTKIHTTTSLLTLSNSEDWDSDITSVPGVDQANYSVIVLNPDSLFNDLTLFAVYNSWRLSAMNFEAIKQGVEGPYGGSKRKYYVYKTKDKPKLKKLGKAASEAARFYQNAYDAANPRVASKAQAPLSALIALVGKTSRALEAIRLQGSFTSKTDLGLVANDLSTSLESILSPDDEEKDDVDWNDQVKTGLRVSSHTNDAGEMSGRKLLMYYNSNKADAAKSPDIRPLLNKLAYNDDDSVEDETHFNRLAQFYSIAISFLEGKKKKKKGAKKKKPIKKRFFLDLDLDGI